MATMDPPHITEFASDRYFSKLHQLQDPGNNAQDSSQVHGPSASGVASSATSLPTLNSIETQSPFILPLRGSPTVAGPVDPTVIHPKKLGSRFFGLRNKLPIIHSKPLPHPREHGVTPEQQGISAATPLDELFMALPNELQIQIINSLHLPDILNLRLASRSWHALITFNEGPIVRHFLDHHIPQYALRLYPSPNPCKASFHHLCGLWHRLHVASKLAYLMCDWVTDEIFLRKTREQKIEFLPQRERMRRRLIPLLFTIFHFFENYRKFHLDYLCQNNGYGLRHEPFTLNPIEAKIMNQYDDKTLLRVHQVFPLVISSFVRQLRPPSYVGRVERSLRGYLKDKATDDMHAAILCIGGLRQVERFWEISGYNSRLSAVEHWYSTMTKQIAAEPMPLPLPSSKPKLSFKSLGRKKSMAAIKAAHPQTPIPPLPQEWPQFHALTTADDSAAAAPPFANYYGNGMAIHDQNSRSSYHSGGTWSGQASEFQRHQQPQQPYPSHSYVNCHHMSPIFNTSLAAGMPMPALSNDTARLLQPDLPHLQSIWRDTAEAIILDRKIVEKSADIMRNAQVMRELIREDGIDEEDEWWYGKSQPDIVRPSVPPSTSTGHATHTQGSTDPDAIEPIPLRF